LYFECSAPVQYIHLLCAFVFLLKIAGCVCDYVFLTELKSTVSSHFVSDVVAFVSKPVDCTIFHVLELFQSTIKFCCNRYIHVSRVVHRLLSATFTGCRLLFRPHRVPTDLENLENSWNFVNL